MRRKGQSSFEYILLAGIALFFVLTGVALFFNYSTRQSDELSRAAVSKIGTDVMNSVEKVYYVGGSSWETMRINVPSNVRRIYVDDNELVVEYASLAGNSQAVFFSDVNITTPYGDGNISAIHHTGVTTLKVTSFGSYVNITEIS